MSSVVITKKNETYIRVDAEPSILQELSDLFTFDAPNAQFSPKYKNGYWDGKIKLLRPLIGETYLGLIPHIEQYCQENGYTLDNRCVLVHDDITEEDWQTFAHSLPLTAHGDALDVREYQIEAAYVGLQKARAILLSPTGSGKSLILYLMLRWHQEHERKQLLLVPNTSLVEQMYGDFADYSATDDEWDVEEQCARIYSGQTKDYGKNVTISTWQSLALKPKEFFEQFDVVYGDEAHLCKAKVLTSILEKCINAAFKVGTTGTLDGSLVNKLVLEGLFGKIYEATTTKQLMDDGQLAKLKIRAILLQYPNDQRKHVANHQKEYAQEINFLVSHPLRNAFITNLTLKLKGNTLVLFQLVEKHGEILYDLINAGATADRRVFFVHGGVDSDERETVRAIAEKERDCIIVASKGVFAQGTNIRNLHNIILASPTKSRIQNLQSIGRGLRIGDTKDACTVYDIGDDLAWKSRQNYTLTHFTERIKLYAKERFNYTLIPVPLIVE